MKTPHGQVMRGGNGRYHMLQGASCLLVETGLTSSLFHAWTANVGRILRQQPSPYSLPSLGVSDEKTERRMSAVMTVMFYFKIKYGSC